MSTILNEVLTANTGYATRIRNHPLVPRDIPVYGYIYDVKSGRLIEVSEASAIGKAS